MPTQEKIDLNDKEKLAQSVKRTWEFLLARVVNKTFRAEIDPKDWKSIYGSSE